MKSMCLVSVKDFGIALKVSGGTIRSKITRKQLRCNKSKLIDTENPVNYIYILEVNGGNQEVFAPYDLKTKNRTNVQRKVAIQTIETVKVLEVEKSTPKSSVKSKKTNLEDVSDSNGSVNIAKAVETKKESLTTDEKRMLREQKLENQAAKSYNDTLLEIEIRKKKADLRLVERGAEIKEMQLEKIAGNTIPLDQVESLMAINYKAIFKSFHSQLKNIASTTVLNLGGTNDDLHSIMKELEQVLNHIIEKSKEKAQVDVDRLIEEYSERRSRGERK